MTETANKTKTRYTCLSCNKYYYCYNKYDCNNTYCENCKPPSSNGNELIGVITHGQGELIIGDLARPKSGVVYVKNRVVYNGCKVQFYKENGQIYEECDPDHLNPTAYIRNRLWRFLDCNSCNTTYEDGRGNLQGYDVAWCLTRGNYCEPSPYESNPSFNKLYECCSLKFFRRYCNNRPPEWCLERIEGTNEYYILSRPYHTYKKYYLMIDLKYNLTVVLPAWFDDELRFKKLKFIPVDKSTITPIKNDKDECNGCTKPNVIENYKNIKQKK